MQRPDSEVKKRLKSSEVRQIVQWFMESVDDGWRPRIYVQSSVEELYDIAHLALYSKVGRGETEEN